MSDSSSSSSSSGAGFTPRMALTVRDERTGKTYEVPITNNSIPATAFSRMVAPRQAIFGQEDREEDETAGGLRVSDPAFSNTAAVTSRITFIDGNRGVLRYRGYPIEVLAEKSSFLESAYLLVYGELPTAPKLAQWEGEVMHHTFLHSDIERLLSSFNDNAHPMSVLASSFAALGALAPEANPSLQGQNIYADAAKGDKKALRLMDKQIYRCIGKAPILAAAAYRVRQGRPFNRPPSGLSYAGTFLYCLDQLNEREYKPNPIIERAIDRLWLVHADHEMNASTASVLQVSSSLVDPYSAVAAGVASLYGPLHGGAAEAVVRQLLLIGTPDKVPEYLEKVKRKERTLSGFGHRVYRTTDPRAHIVRKCADEVFSVVGRSPLLDTALALRDAALKDPYFIERKLAPNVDFFSGVIYYSIGLPLDLFCVMFAVPRVAGWLATWRQSMLDPKKRIWRPKQLYVGSGEREYVPIAERTEVRDAPASASPSVVEHGGITLRSKLASWVDHNGRRHGPRL